jgi:hypothetical protein
MVQSWWICPALGDSVTGTFYPLWVRINLADMRRVCQ